MFVFGNFAPRTTKASLRYLKTTFSSLSQLSYSRPRERNLSFNVHITQSRPISSPSPTYQWQEGVEDLDGYCPGGYHPTHIGDRFFDGRYEIVHKLDHGSYSTVWLAKDHMEPRYIALKILIASAYKVSPENKILRALSTPGAHHEGSAYVSSVLDEFTIHGPNGCHLCIVSDAAGCSVAQSKEASITWKFQVNVARAISAQLLLGLTIFILVVSCIELPEIALSTDEKLYLHLGEPQKLPVKRLDNRVNGPEVPKYCVPPAMIFQSTPEIFFHERASQASDVWTLACTLYEILGERPLFESFMPDQDHVIAEMVSTLGHLPKRWWDSWRNKKDFFLEDGSWRLDTERCHAPYSRPLHERLRIME
ncbi:kinase domain-containing protein [Penicillium freii]|nr:kinase domain-containing protein [Penicillium freii]